MTNLSKSLHQAAATGDIALINSLVAQGADINAWDAWGHEKTPLIYAVEAKQADAVKTLISLGADVNMLGYDGINAFHTPIYFACDKIVDLVESGFINANSTFGDKNPLDWQINAESNFAYLKITYELLNAGAKPVDLSNKSLAQALSLSAEEGNLAIVQSLVQDYHADILMSTNFISNAIVSAASAGNADILDYLLSTPHFMFDKNYKSILSEALISAVANNSSRIDIAKMLITAGADVNGTSEFSYALKYAIYSSHEPNFEMAKLLLDNGADIKPLQENVKFDIINNLILDNYAEHVKSIYNFINEYSDFKIDVNIDNNKWGGTSYGISSFDLSIQVQTSKGDTPLHTAVQANCTKGIEFLLELGANPTLKNAQGESVLDYAMKYASDDVKVAISESYDSFKSEIVVEIETNAGSASYLDMLYNLFGSNNKSNTPDIKLSDVIDVQSTQSLDSLLDNANMTPSISAQSIVLITHDVLPAPVLTQPEVL